MDPEPRVSPVSWARLQLQQKPCESGTLVPPLLAQPHVGLVDNAPSSHVVVALFPPVGMVTCFPMPLDNLNVHHPSARPPPPHPRQLWPTLKGACRTT